MKNFLLSICLSLITAACSTGDSFFGTAEDRQAVLQNEDYETGGLPEASFSSPCKSELLARRKAERLVVKIKSRFPGKAISTEVGSGIIVARRNGRIYVVTAEHVVEDKSGTGGQVISVNFGNERWHNAQLSRQFRKPSGNYDIALIEVVANAENLRSDDGDFTILSHADNVSRINRSLAIGYPAGGPLSVSNLAPARYNRQQIHLGAIIQSGNSGGGAFDQQMRLVGMIYANERDGARAYSIHHILEMIVASGLPVDLAEASVPNVQVRVGDVLAEPQSLQDGLKSAVFKALEAEGLEPGCSSSAYVVSMKAVAHEVSLTETIVRVTVMLGTPNAANLPLLDEEVRFLHLPLQNPLKDPKDIETKIADWTPHLMKKLSVYASAPSNLTQVVE